LAACRGLQNEQLALATHAERGKEDGHGCSLLPGEESRAAASGVSMEWEEAVCRREEPGMLVSFSYFDRIEHGMEKRNEEVHD
jgi:hypothetical protein